jgi:hypothetical protein
MFRGGVKVHTVVEGNNDNVGEGRGGEEGRRYLRREVKRNERERERERESARGPSTAEKAWKAQQARQTSSEGVLRGRLRGF